MFESSVWLDKVSVTSFVVIAGSLCFLLQRSQTFSSYKLFYIFTLLFLGVAPLNYYWSKVSLFGARQLTSTEYFVQNIGIIAIMVSFHLLYKYFWNKDRFVPEFRHGYFASDALYYLCLSLLFLANKMLLFHPFSVTVFWRRSYSEILDMLPTSLDLIIRTAVFVLPLVFFGHLFILWRKKLNWLRILILSLLLLAGFPTTLSRTSAAVVLTPLLFFVLPTLLRKNNFVYVFIPGFIYFFPFLDQFRRISSLRELKFGFDFSVFKTAHFDSYYNAALIISELPLQYGNQLLGALLFFVPRAFWPEKPIGTGTFMAQRLNMTFENLSANYFAEGFVNFGLLGVLGFLMVLAFVLAGLDKWLKTALKSDQTHLYVALQLVFSTFYLLRGDLMSSFAFIASIGIMNMIVIMTFNTRSK